MTVPAFVRAVVLPVAIGSEVAERLGYAVGDPVVLTHGLRGGVRYFDNESRNDTFMDLPLYASFSSPTILAWPNSLSRVRFG